jgi:hypothetical protein
MASMRPSWPPPMMPIVRTLIAGSSTGYSATEFDWFSRHSSKRWASSSLSASTAAASSAALTAPAGRSPAFRPECRPASARWRAGCPGRTAPWIEPARRRRQRRHRRRHAGQVRGTAGAGTMILKPSSPSRHLRETVQPVGRAMRRNDACLISTPEASSVSAAFFIVSQSDWLPMMMATGGVSVVSKASRPVARSGDDVGNDQVFNRWKSCP